LFLFKFKRPKIGFEIIKWGSRFVTGNRPRPNLGRMLIRNLTHSVFAILFIVLFAFSNSVAVAQEDIISDDPAVISTGKQLFDGNCKACHKIHERLVGPALQDVYNRAPSIDWIKSFIKNPPKMIQGGDEYANALYNEYKSYMTAFPFEDEQIMALMAYIKDETNKGPAVVAPTDGGAADVGTGSASAPSEYLNLILIGLVVVLVLIFGVLIMIVNVMKRYLNKQEGVSEEDKEIVSQSFSISSLVRSKPFIFIATFLIVALIFKGVINGLFSIGIQRGYKPTQPIAFSHKIHAGDNQIDCNYCHTGVRKSKSANIPSANICMNCHSSILVESPEIQKIYAAVENNQPIEWVRIHNLPDLVYFNHSQHVQVGGLECQTCHGQIQEMEVVEQQTNLTMGWCVECHRTTEVNSKGNAYYEKLLEYHKGKGNEIMTVEDIGGLECAKCHY